MTMLMNYWDKIALFPNVVVTESNELRNNMPPAISKPAYGFICEIFKNFQLEKIECILEGEKPTIILTNTFENKTVKDHVLETIKEMIQSNFIFEVNFNFSVKE